MKQTILTAILIVACSNVFAAQANQNKGEVMMEKDLIDTAVAAGEFSTLAAALKAADLIPTLKGKGPFTVFAPTDSAFEKLPAGTVEKLLMPQNKAALTRVLTYHVVAGRVSAADMTKLTEAKTMEGTNVAIKTERGAVIVGENSRVTGTDVNATNGIIHIVDHVILPPNLNL